MSEVTVGKQPCPKCPSSDGYHLYDDGHGYCFSCSTYFNSNRDFSNLNYTYEYLQRWGITRDTMRFYDIKTKIDDEGKPVSVGFKYPSSWYKVRLTDKKEFYVEGKSKPELFGMDKFAAGSHKYVTITEGEKDAASLYQVIRAPTVSVQGASSAVRDCTAARSWLNQFERIYLALDGDAPGREAAAGIARLFDYNKIYQVKFSNRKDANEYLLAGEENDLLNIWKNAKHFLPDYIKSSLFDFKTILDAPHQDGVPYPFPSLTEMTYGIHPGELVLITAQEGIGKTEVMHAIEYQLLRETQSNVAAIFLEELERRHLQALAGIHLQKPAHLPDGGVTDAEVYRAVEEIVGHDDRLHVYSHFGSDDPDVLLDSIRFLVTARDCKYVLLDHISMVVSGRTDDDERRTLDYIATKLETMVRELNFAMIVVSHVNDFGQTRGSRYISKVADIKIKLDRDIEAGSNVVNFTITKPSRLTGRSGPAGNYSFNPSTRRFTPVSGEAANGNAQANQLAV